MKKTRKEREREIIAQMEEALRENEEQKKKAEGEGSQTENAPQEEMPQLHCRKCKTLMENGKCPACGHTVYMPMDPKTQRSVRLALGIVCLVAFVVILLVTK